MTDEQPDHLELDTPLDLRPDLSELGIDEVERGVCQDSFENRSLLRTAKLGWDPVYAANGAPTGLIRARSKDMVMQRRLLSLAEKRPIMADPDSKNSDYLTGYDLLAESQSDALVPAWVLNATRVYLREQEAGGPASAKRKPAACPHRCRHVKEDNIRCMLWSSGRPADDGLCRVHLGHVRRKPGDDVERARQKLVQAAPYAVDTLEELMTSAESEPVRLKASTEILDRAGLRGGFEVDTNVNVEVRPAAEVLAERLSRLAGGALAQATLLSAAGVAPSAEPDPNTVDAEVVEADDPQPQPEA